jgi:hypothetical protein
MRVSSTNSVRELYLIYIIDIKDINNLQVNLYTYTYTYMYYHKVVEYMSEIR